MMIFSSEGTITFFNLDNDFFLSILEFIENLKILWKS
jgi:hypothetical protein